MDNVVRVENARRLKVIEEIKTEILQDDKETADDPDSDDWGER